MKSLRHRSQPKSVAELSELPAANAGWKDPLNPLEEVVRMRLSACLNQVFELSQINFKKELPQIAWLLDSATAHLQAFQAVLSACGRPSEGTGLKGLAAAGARRG